MSFDADLQKENFSNESCQPHRTTLLATGYSVTITAEKALKMGIKAYLHKPIVEADLARTVRNVLDDGKRPA